MTTIETIYLTDSARLRVVVDEGPECPRGDWHMLTGFVKIGSRGDSRYMDVPAVREFPGDIERAAMELEGPHYTSRQTETVERWARIFHDTTIEYDSAHGGYWFVAGADAATYATPEDGYARCLFRDNWPELLPGTPESFAKQAEVIAQEQETYRQWAEGEVYGVILERLVSHACYEVTRTEDGFEVDDPGAAVLSDDWEQPDGDSDIWGNYLNDDYTAKDVAKEHFDLTDDERSAIG